MFMKDCVQCVGPQDGAEEEREEEESETTHNELTTISVPCSPVPVGGKEVQEWSWAWEEETWGEDVLRYFFYFLSYTDLISNKLN